MSYVTVGSGVKKNETVKSVSVKCTWRSFLENKHREESLKECQGSLTFAFSQEKVIYQGD